MVKELNMYFDKKIAESFAKHEKENFKHIAVSNIIDKIATLEILTLEKPFYVAELGGGANPIFYQSLFRKLGVFHTE